MQLRSLQLCMYMYMSIQSIMCTIFSNGDSRGVLRFPETSPNRAGTSIGLGLLARHLKRSRNSHSK